MKLSRSKLRGVPGAILGPNFNRRAVRDTVAVLIFAVFAFAIVEWLDLFAAIMRFESIYGRWGLDDLAMMLMVSSFALFAFAWRRMTDLTHENRRRVRAETKVIEQMREARRARAFLNTIVDNVPVTIFVRQLPERRFVLVNHEGEKLLGVRRGDLLGKRVSDVFPADSAREIEEHDEIQLRSHDPVVFPEVPVPTRDNGMRATVATAVAVRDHDGTARYLVNVVEDVTERKRAQERIEHLAHHDVLTDLPNRAAFNAAVDAALNDAGATGANFALLSIDLDRFKEINDVFGHATGDALLQAVGKRLAAGCEGAFLARIGGDEFSVISGEGQQPAAAETLAARLLDAINGDIDLDCQTVRIGMSIGIAIYPADGTDADVLQANADAALYRAKSEGRSSVRFFAPDMDRRLRERRLLHHDLRSALERDEMQIYFQPQAAIDGRITGFEALLRWRHPTRGMVDPREFIPLAEETGLIIPIGEWVLREACREAASWKNPLGVAVNLSPVQFRHGDLPALVHSVLLDSGLTIGRLEIEITESVLIDDFTRAVAILRQLKALGVRIAMDDFGTGYSSLAYLQAFPFDEIKIDQSFIANFDRNPQSAAIIRAVIGLGRGLDLPVMVEGVETKEQLSFLARESCNGIQGYIVGRPAPIESYAELVGRSICRKDPGALQPAARTVASGAGSLQIDAGYRKGRPPMEGLERAPFSTKAG